MSKILKGDNKMAELKFRTEKVSEIPMEFKGDAGMAADGNAKPGHGNIVYHPDRILHITEI